MPTTSPIIRIGESFECDVSKFVLGLVEPYQQRFILEFVAMLLERDARVGCEAQGDWTLGRGDVAQGYAIHDPSSSVRLRIGWDQNVTFGRTQSSPGGSQALRLLMWHNFRQNASVVAEGHINFQSSGTLRRLFSGVSVAEQTEQLRKTVETIARIPSVTSTSKIYFPSSRRRSVWRVDREVPIIKKMAEELSMVLGRDVKVDPWRTSRSERSDAFERALIAERESSAGRHQPYLGWDARDWSAR